MSKVELEDLFWDYLSYMHDSLCDPEERQFYLEKCLRLQDQIVRLKEEEERAWQNIN